MKTIYKKVTVTALIILLAICCVFALMPLHSARTEVNAEFGFDSDEIAQYYIYNESKVFPKGISVEYNGKDYQAKNGVLVFPNGIIRSISDDAISLNQMGKYSAKYFFTADGGEAVCAVDSFLVSKSKYGFSLANGSSAVFAQSTSEICKDEADNVLFTGQNGIILRLNSGSSFNYNVPVDLSKANSGNLSEIITLDPRLHTVKWLDETPTDSEGNPLKDPYGNDLKGNAYNYNGLIAEEVIITVTDCYDPLKYFEIIIDCQDDEGYGSFYVRAKLGGRDGSFGFPRGEGNAREGADYSYEAMQDNIRRVIYRNRFGAYGGLGVKTRRDYGCSLLYDNATNRLYITGSNSTDMVMDFTNPTIFGANTFEGFTTGEVYVSVRANTYLQNEAARVDLLSIGADADSVVSLNSPIYEDTTPPKVEILIDKTDESGIYAAKGETVKIPEARVWDVNYNGNLAVRVYRNYGLENQSMISVENNSFKAAFADTYTIEYVATDDFGNVSYENNTLNVMVLDSQSASLMLSVDKISEVYVGENNLLPEHTISTLNDSSKIKFEIEVTRDGKSVSVNPDDRLFKPQYFGEYTIEYKLSDNVNSLTYFYTFTATGKENTVFLEKPYLYRYYIKDAAYNIEPLKAYAKQSDGSYSPVDTDCYVSFDDGDFAKVDNINSVAVLGNTKIAVKFVHDGISSETTYADIVDVGYGQGMLSLADYFVGNYTSTVSTDIIYTSNVSSGKNVLKFINPLVYNNFVLEYQIPTGTDKFGKLNIRLIDAKDESKVMSVSVGKSSTNLALASVNGATEFTMGSDFSGNSSTRLSYSFDRGYMYVGTVKYPLAAVLQSGLAYLEIEMENITGPAAISVKTINNSSFNSYIVVDNSTPEIWVDRKYGRYEIGEVITLGGMVCSDVLSPINITTRKLSVKAPSGSFVTAIDGTVLNGVYGDEYRIYLSEYGNYSVTYIVEDIKSNSFTLSYNFSVVDQVAPTIILDEGYDEDRARVVSVGETIKILYGVSDNITSSDKLYCQINLFDKTLSQFYVDVGNEINFNQAGEYRLYIYCMDEAGNSSYRYYDIIVK